MEEILKEAKRLGIIVIPEIDTPGHAKSLAESEDLKSIDACLGYEWKNYTDYCYEPPCG